MAACQKATASEGHTNLHLTDAHCHPQLDPANMQAVLQLKSSKLAAMSVSYDVDWEIMLQLHQLAGVLKCTDMLHARAAPVLLVVTMLFRRSKFFMLLCDAPIVGIQPALAIPAMP